MSLRLFLVLGIWAAAPARAGIPPVEVFYYRPNLPIAVADVVDGPREYKQGGLSFKGGKTSLQIRGVRWEEDALIIDSVTGSFSFTGIHQNLIGDVANLPISISLRSRAALRLTLPSEIALSAQVENGRVVFRCTDEALKGFFDTELAKMMSGAELNKNFTLSVSTQGLPDFLKNPVNSFFESRRGELVEEARKAAKGAFSLNALSQAISQGNTLPVGMPASIFNGPWVLKLFAIDGKSLWRLAPSEFVREEKNSAYSLPPNTEIVNQMSTVFSNEVLESMVDGYLTSQLTGPDVSSARELDQSGAEVVARALKLDMPKDSKLGILIAGEHKPMTRFWWKFDAAGAPHYYMDLSLMLRQWSGSLSAETPVGMVFEFPTQTTTGPTGATAGVPRLIFAAIVDKPDREKVPQETLDLASPRLEQVTRQWLTANPRMVLRQIRALGQAGPRSDSRPNEQYASAVTVDYLVQTP